MRCLCIPFSKTIARNADFAQAAAATASAAAAAEAKGAAAAAAFQITDESAQDTWRESKTQK